MLSRTAILPYAQRNFCVFGLLSRKQVGNRKKRPSLLRQRARGIPTCPQSFRRKKEATKMLHRFPGLRHSSAMSSSLALAKNRQLPYRNTGRFYLWDRGFSNKKAVILKTTFTLVMWAAFRKGTRLNGIQKSLFF